MGIYQLNIQILFGLEIIPLALYSFLLSEEASGKSHYKISLMVILFSTLISLIVFFWAPSIMGYFFPAYVDGVQSLQIMIFSLVPLSISYILSAKLQAKKSSLVGYSGLVRISSLIILIIILEHSLIGLSFAVLISSLMYLVTLIFIFKHEKIGKI